MSILGVHSGASASFMANPAGVFFRAGAQPDIPVMIEEAVDGIGRDSGFKFRNILPKTPRGWLGLLVVGGATLYAFKEWWKGRAAPDFSLKGYEAALKDIVARTTSPTGDPFTVIIVKPAPITKPKDGKPETDLGEDACEALLVSCAASKLGVDPRLIFGLLRGTLDPSKSTEIERRSAIYYVIAFCWHDLIAAGCEGYLKKLLGSDVFEIFQDFATRFSEEYFRAELLRELSRRGLVIRF
jgi:hypothetical protein